MFEGALLSRDRVFAALPVVRLRDYRGGGGTSWDRLDDHVSRVVGTDAVAIPSVRVAALWLLEFLGCNRHSSEILVPQFLGRCILSSLNRRAMPVYAISSRTKMALVVHQFGFLQRLPLIEPELSGSGIAYVEDSPAGLDFKEACGPHSLGRLIALSKILPILKGGIFVSARRDLLEFIRAKRTGESPWSWIILLGLASCRRQATLPLHVGWMDAVYELYPLSPADNRVFRNNLWHGLSHLDFFQETTERRLDLIGKRLGRRALLPDLRRVSAIVPFVADGIEEKAREIFARHRMDPGSYHFDERANFLAPGYRLVFLIPVNPSIPQEVFESVVTDLARA